MLVSVPAQYPMRAAIMAQPKMMRRIKTICRVLTGMFAVLRPIGAIEVDGRKVNSRCKGVEMFIVAAEEQC